MRKLKIEKMNNPLHASETGQTFLAVDLGATSGRTILGTQADGKIEQRELTRFANPMIQLRGHLYWDIYALYAEIVHALCLVADEGIALTSIGIDTWGCDFVMVGKDGGLLRNPYCYRDQHTQGAMEELFRRMPRETVYEKTGIQFMPFNSLFQLDTLQRHGDSALAAAEKILFIPDALTYLLTGEAVCEYTVLSTSQLLNPRTRRIDTDLLRLIGLEERQFGRMVEPGQVVGTLSPEVQRLTGLGAVPVVAVAGHDTASAVAAVPARDQHFAYLSLGTWSLLGIETEQPIISTESLHYNLTNEGGVDGTTRVLKNICGMWLLEQCRKEWSDAPQEVNRINDEAMQVEWCGSLVNPDDPRFANPPSMVEAITGYCRETGQPVPADYRQMARTIFESLAHRYAEALRWLSELAPFSIDRLHVIGGGSRNGHLMQLAANATGLPVIAGPAEGTAMGNILMQARAAGMDVGLYEMRQIVANSVQLKTYEPRQ